MFYYSVSGLQIEAPHVEGAESVLTPEALAFLVDLERHFGAERAAPAGAPRRAAGAARRRRAAGLPARDRGDPRGRLEGRARSRPTCSTAASRSPARSTARWSSTRSTPARAASWPTSRTPPRPPGTHHRGPAQPPRRRPRRDRLRRSPSGKAYRLNEQTAALLVRPRGWHLPRSTCWSTASPSPARLFDFGLYLFHNAQGPAGQGHRPLLLPAQAREPSRGPALERRLRRWPSASSGCRSGTIKATVLIETILAAFEMDEILYELRDHIGGPQLRPLGLHLQLHQEVPQPAESCCPTARW